jgi:hypothetical protein
MDGARLPLTGIGCAAESHWVHTARSAVNWVLTKGVEQCLTMIRHSHQ